MLETMDYLLKYSLKQGRKSKGIIWAHNTHIGDYRATNMKKDGYVNIGGLARQSYDDEQVGLIGFGTHHGTVLASRAWGRAQEIMNIPSPAPNTYEDFFHQALQLRKLKQGYLILDGTLRESSLANIYGHRAIGVVYQPERESRGNYVPTSLSKRYDAFVFIDQTTAVHSLPTIQDYGKFPETWPQGM